jgi:putative membrane protein
LTSRGLVVIAAIAGFLWQADIDGWEVGRYLPSIGPVWRTVKGSTPTLLFELVALGLVVVLLFRLLSAAWMVVKHFDFSLTARGGELFQSYGLLTRVGRTIPRARIQKLTITEDLLMRKLHRATVSVDTAASVGDKTGDQSLRGSQVLVPIVGRAQLATLVREVQPAGSAADLADVVDFEALDWQPVHPRAFARLARIRVAFAAAAGFGLWFALGWWAWAGAALVAAWLVVLARAETRVAGFAWAGETLLFRSGAWRRQISLVRAARMQVVGVTRSPFDRRWGMAAVSVDTAGAAGGGHHVHIPWLPESVATELYARLRHASASS